MKRFIIFLLVSFCFLASCDDKNSEGRKVTVEFEYKKFNTEKTLWNSDSPSNYQYNLEYWNTGFSTPVNTLIFVENGQYKNQIPQENHESTFYLTITDVYNYINELYLQYNNTTQDKNKYYLKKIIIKYDEAHHIPIEIYEYYQVPANLADAASYCETKITQYKIN